MGNENLTKMTDFNIEDFDVSSTEKYCSCSVEGRPLSPKTLTDIFNNGWKLIDYNAYSHTKYEYKSEPKYVEVFTYMFENTNYGKVERV